MDIISTLWISIGVFVWTRSISMCYMPTIKRIIGWTFLDHTCRVMSSGVNFISIILRFFVISGKITALFAFSSWLITIFFQHCYLQRLFLMLLQLIHHPSHCELIRQLNLQYDCTKPFPNETTKLEFDLIEQIYLTSK